MCELPSDVRSLSKGLKLHGQGLESGRQSFGIDFNDTPPYRIHGKYCKKLLKFLLNWRKNDYQSGTGRLSGEGF